MIPAPILNHLWQSTIFALASGVLTLALKKNRAPVRYWIRFAASAKFLVPFSILVAVESQFEWREAQAVRLSPIPMVIEQISQPLAPPTLLSIPAKQPPVSTAGILLSVWLGGLSVVVFGWTRQWWLVRSALRAASPLNLDLPIRAMSSPARLEPGVFGIFRPVLLVPEGIADRLTQPQWNAIVAHELCHVRRRDNLTAAIHMFVEAVFWFYPLAWWIGKRLVDERERACDEAVLSLGSEPQVYAEGILNVCKFYVGSPVACVSGVTGSDLKKRLRRIMAERVAGDLNFSKKLVLVAAGTAAVAGPIMIGLGSPSYVRAQSQSAKAVAFEVASVKPHASGANRLTPPTFLAGGRFVSEYPLQTVIAAAYGLPFNGSSRLMGIPDWARSQSQEGVYSIEATGVIPAGLSVKARNDRLKLMLQTLLADRFKLAIHRDAKEMPVYALVVGKGGPKLQIADVDEKDCPDGSVTLPGTSDLACHTFQGGRVRGLQGRAVDMSDLVSAMEYFTDRPLLDKTGIKGLFHIETKGWLPLQPGSPPAQGAGSEGGADTSDVPTLFNVFEQLGLKMESQRARVDVYVIDHVERPSAN